jgi:2-(3-amino-3-carboxypropyl)histidine synthase
MQVRYVFAKKYVPIEPVLEKSLQFIKGKVGVITAIQFLHLMKDVKSFFEKRNIPCDVLGQVLGCNIKVAENSDADTILYFGDGLFHPKAMPAMKGKQTHIVLADPLSNIARVMTEEEVNTFEGRRTAGLAKFYSSKNIGVLTTLKPGQEQIKAALTLKEKYPDKNFYILLFDDLNWGLLEDFPFVECYINTMCPRIAYDDYHKLPRPVVDYLDIEEMRKHEPKIIAH